MPLKPSGMPSVEDSELLARVKPALLLAVTVSAEAALSVSDPVPVQPLTVKVLPPAVSVRLAAVIPLSARVGSPVTAREVLVNVVFPITVSTKVSAVPVSNPFPAQPVMVKVLPPELVSVRLAVVMPLKETAMPSVDISEVLVRVKPAFLLAVTMPVAVSVSEPLPVQPLTVNVFVALVAARLAVVMPLRPSAMPSVEDSEVLVRVKLALLLAVTVSGMDALSVSVPLPVQPLTVKVLPPAVSVRLAVVKPLNVNAGRPVTASDVLARTTLLDTTSTKVSVEPLSVPLPAQPVMVKV